MFVCYFRFAWLKVKGLGETRNWVELEKFSKSKSPIGYVVSTFPSLSPFPSICLLKTFPFPPFPSFQPFVEECLNKNAKTEALKYIPRCEVLERPQLYMRIGAFQEAAEAAFQAKDAQLLMEIKGKSGSLQVSTQVDGYLSQLAGKR